MVKARIGKGSKSQAGDYERGLIERVVLTKPFVLNGSVITDAIIEIDHINYGLDKKTFKLNLKRRSNFTVADIEKFLFLLNGEFIAYRKVRKKRVRFEIRIDSPIVGKHFGKEFLMVFETDLDKKSLIHTITLFRIGK